MTPTDATRTDSPDTERPLDLVLAVLYAAVAALVGWGFYLGAQRLLGDGSFPLAAAIFGASLVLVYSFLRWKS